MAIAHAPIPFTDTAWMNRANCKGLTDLFFAPPGERPEQRDDREAQALGLCTACVVSDPCRSMARDQREYGYWGGESEETRAAAGYRVEMPVGRIARYPKGNGTPVKPRVPRTA